MIVGGKTYEGRLIQGLRINTPGDDENKPVIFIESGKFLAMMDVFSIDDDTKRCLNIVCNS